MKLSDIKPNPDNPRIIKEDKFKKLVQSIKDFPDMLEKRPIVIDEDNIVLGGNMRLRALQELGYKDVPVIVAKGWTEEQKKEFIVKDNVGFGEWDWDILANEWSDNPLTEWGLDVWQPEEVEKLNSDPYTTKINAPIYTPKGTMPSIDSLRSQKKYKSLIEEIESANLPTDLDLFLRQAATRHIVFDYEQIAEYYSHAQSDVKKLMESSALVIIDFGQAIEQGFLRLNKELKSQYIDEHE